MSESQVDPGPRPWSADRFEIDAVAVCDLSRADAFEHLRAAMDRGEQVALGFCNANMLLKALCSASYAAALKHLVLLNDGVGLDLCSLLFRGRSFRENLNGTDFVPALLGGDARARTLFLLGARPGVAEAAARTLALRYPQHRVVGTRDGYFASDETDSVIAEINAAAPDILLVALGNPDQETFIAENAHRIDARLLMGVGALIDYTAGIAVRAPAPVAPAARMGLPPAARAAPPGAPLHGRGRPVPRPDRPAAAGDAGADTPRRDAEHAVTVPGSRSVTRTDADHARPRPDAEIPVAIDGLHGWFAPGSSRRAVLLCGTYGFEQLCAYRAWRDLARMIAASGCATLRLDYPGQGDSTDGPPEEDTVAASVRAIRRGIAFLRAEGGADEIVLVGLRLGATLAALAAREGGVDRLALLAPFATGKAYLREMTMQARLLDVLPDRTPLEQPAGALLIGSFHLGPDALAALARLDPAAEPGVAPAQVLLLGARTDALAGHYRRLGSAVETGTFPDLTQLVSDPLFATAPAATFAAVRDFACAGARPRIAPARTPALPEAPCRIAGERWSEETTLFGSGLAGTLCEPRGTHAGGAAVLFINSGRNVRCGQGRQTTRLARRLAAAGTASLRFDHRASATAPTGPTAACRSTPRTRSPTCAPPSTI